MILLASGPPHQVVGLAHQVGQGCYLQGPFIVPQRKNILHFSEWARMGLHF